MRTPKGGEIQCVDVPSPAGVSKVSATFIRVPGNSPDVDLIPSKATEQPTGHLHWHTPFAQLTAITLFEMVCFQGREGCEFWLRLALGWQQKGMREEKG